MSEPPRSKIFSPACRFRLARFVVVAGDERSLQMIELKPRFFVLPAIALAVIAMLHGAADGSGSTSKRGATVPIADPAIRASFEAFQLSQSVAAARKCQVACNNEP